MKKSKSIRDDFTQATLDTLAKRVGVRCSNPRCRKLTTGPRSDATKIVNIGVGAHITAATSNGPRYDESLSSDERKSPDNGIWLCQHCAKLVDNDPARYTIEILKTWKQQAENAALTEIEKGVSLPENLIDLDISYKKIRQESARHDYVLEVKATNLSNEQIGSYHVDLELPACVIEHPERIDSFVEDRSTRDVSFFRVNYSDDPIYPGDTKLLLAVPYYMNTDIYRNRDRLFDVPVRSTVFRQGYQPLIVEKPFGELQFF